jgi:hypothetical protein
MTSDRYLKAILTVIALELLWIGIKDGAPAVSAQPAVTPVVIHGVQMDTEARGSLPITIRGLQLDTETRGTLPVSSPRPLRIESLRPLKIEADRPIKIETDGPLSVESVPYTPSKRPG